MRDGTILRLCVVLLAVLYAGMAQGQRAVSDPRAGRINSETARDSIPDFNLSDRLPVLSVSQIMEGALSDTYLVGPGDGFLITIWGKRNEYFRTVVTPEGKLFIPEIAELHVAGLTLARMRQILGAEIDRYFIDVKANATLIQLRQFQVYVLGEVERPGAYAAHAVDRVSQLVERAGGALPAASSRSIEIRHAGGGMDRADLSRFTHEGLFGQNPYVRDGDVILVPRRTAMVKIFGAVWAPGEYEYRSGDTLGDLIRLARDFRPEALRREVEIVRFRPDGLTTSRLTFDVSDTGSVAWQFALMPDDQVFVRSIPRWHEQHLVTITGEVQNPGTYAIVKDSTTLSYVVAQAGGFTAEALLSESYVVRADTLDSDSTNVKDLEFERLRLIPVQDMNPDEYEYFKMRSRQRRGVLSVDFRRLFQEGVRTEEVVMKKGDRIVVARNRDIVFVTGSVAYPGAIVYDPALTPSDYIQRSGGYGWNARKGKTRVIRAKTGDWLWAGKVKQLGPGDTIWVPEKAYRDWWGIFTQTLATAGQVATIILVVDTVRR